MRGMVVAQSINLLPMLMFGGGSMMVAKHIYGSKSVTSAFKF